MITKNLILNAIDGDARAFTELFNDSFIITKTYLYNRFKWIDDEDRKDIAIEAVEDILLNLDVVDPEKNIGALICTRAKWKALNFSRWSRRYSYIMDDRDVLLEVYTQIEGTEYDDVVAERNEVMRDTIKKKIKRMSLVDYITLSMYLEGKTYPQIANRLGVNLTAVQSRIEYAKKRLNVMVNGGGYINPYDTAKQLYESIIDKDKLPDADLLKMYYSEGKTANEIGKLTGRTKHAVRSRIQRVRDNFKFYLN